MLRRKPFSCRTLRILHLLQLGSTVGRTYREFTWLRSLGNNENENDIADWVKGSLHEPIPSQHFQEHSLVKDKDGSFQSEYLVSPLKIVPKEEYVNRWHASFVAADLKAVEEILEGIRDKTRLFTLSQLMTLLRSLSSIHRYYEIHEIYCVVQDCIALISDEGSDNSIKQEFLKIVLRAEDNLGNYKLCERIFSEYIKFPRLDRQIISIGLRSFLRNDNLQLAKQFFIQVLENPETFPITKTEFEIFCRELSQFGDLDSMLFVFKLWVTKGCDKTTCCDPGYGTLSLFHRLFILSDDRKGFEKFLNMGVVKRTGYSTDVIFQITEFCQNLHQTKNERSSIGPFTTEKIDQFLTLLERRPRDRRHFYLSLLNALVVRDDFNNIRHVIGKIQQDRDVHLDGSFHHTIAKYFVKHGMLNHITEYYSDVVLNRTAGRIRLKVSHVEQLWNCALQAYPTLTREITNELKIILEKPQHVRAYPQLQQLITQTSKVRKRKVMGGEDYFKSGLPQVDFERLQRFENLVASRDIAGATTTVLESLKRGTKPHFDFYLCAIRRCLSSSLPNLAKTLNDMLSKRYKVPLKLNILWLKYEIVSKYRSPPSESETRSFQQVSLLQSQLGEFGRTHRETLNFQNYLQLSQISILVRDYNQASTLINEAANVIDTKSKQQWLMYYMTALKISARLNNPDEFLTLLRAWNQNSHATLIFRGSIRQIKAYNKLFHKKLDHMSGCDHVSLTDISKEIEFLVEKYVLLKFEGLNESRKLYILLQRWLNQETKELSRLERKRRKALVDVAYSDKLPVNKLSSK